MGALTFDANILSFFFVFIAIVIGFQTYLQLRIRNVLQALTMNADSMVYNIRKFAKGGKKQDVKPPFEEKTSPSCQFCKHRHAYLNIDNAFEDQDDFYHRCVLKDIQVSLKDTCPLFEEEKKVFE